MPNIFSQSAGLTQPSFTDQITDLSSANFSIAASGLGQYYLLYTTSLNSTLSLPSASGLSGGIQRQVGVSLPLDNPPVGLFNGGTPGSAPCYEAAIGPGTLGRVTAVDVSSAQGKWAKTGPGFLRGYPWPSGAVPATKTLGATTIGTQALYNTGGNPITWLTSTLAAFVVPDSSNNVQLYAISVNADRSVNSVSNATQISTGVNAQSASVLALDSTHVIVRYYDNTNSRGTWVCVPITAGNPPTIGTPGTAVNDSSVTAADRLSAPATGMVLDSTTAFWCIGKMVSTTGLNAYYFTVSGTTITFAANNKFNTNDTLAGSIGGTRTSAANMLVVTTSTVVTNFQLQLLNYSGGVITITWTSQFGVIRPDSVASQALTPFALDLAAGIFAVPYSPTLASGLTGGFVILKVNLATGQLYYNYLIRMPDPGNLSLRLIERNLNGFDSGNLLNALLYIGDGELVGGAFWTNTAATSLFIYADLKTALSSGPKSLSTATVPAPVLPATVEPLCYGLTGITPTSVSFAAAFAFDSTTRTLLVVTAPEVASGNLLLNFNTLQIPRR